MQYLKQSQMLLQIQVALYVMELKSSCDAKFASAVDAAIMAYALEDADHCFQAGEGLVRDNVEDTIRNMGYVGRVGMKDNRRYNPEFDDQSEKSIKNKSKEPVRFLAGSLSWKFSS